MICTPHRGSSCVRISHVIHAYSERYSSTLSSPFHPTSSSSHSLSISCTSSCTSSTTLRAVVTLRTSPKRRWSLMTSPTSPQIVQVHADARKVRWRPWFFVDVYGRFFFGATRWIRVRMIIHCSFRPSGRWYFHESGRCRCSPFSYERALFEGGRRAHSREHRRHRLRHCWRHRWYGSCSLRFICRDYVRRRFSLHPLMRWRTLGKQGGIARSSSLPSVNTTQKPTCGRTRVRKGMWKNGWTPLAVSGQRLPVSVGLGLGATATAVVALCNSDPYRLVKMLSTVSNYNCRYCQTFV